MLDSTAARKVANEPLSGRRFFSAGMTERPGWVVLRIAATAPVSTFRGAIANYRWDGDLVGRTEADARSELLAAVERKFGIDAKGALAPVRDDATRVPFPGLATVFISYRRTDNGDGTVTRLHAALTVRMPQARIFFDIADPDPDPVVARRLVRAIQNSPILVAVVGPNWRGDRPGRPPRIFGARRLRPS